MIALVVCCGLFGIGLYGVLTRRDLIGVLASIEVMIGGALLLAVAFGAHSDPGDLSGVHAVLVLVLVLAAAEAAVGLALVIAVAATRHTTRVDELTEVHG